MTIPHKQIEPAARLKFRGTSKFKVAFSNASVKITGDKATVRYRTTMRSPDSLEVVEELYRLRKEKGVWKAYVNRGWPVEMTFGKDRIRYTPEVWAKLDADVESLRNNKDGGSFSAQSRKAKLPLRQR